jgi:hypothetical protein
MTKRTVSITLVLIVGVIALGVGAVVGRGTAQRGAVAPGSIVSLTGSTTTPEVIEPITPSDNVFDATETIPGTSVSVAYPKNGFWGLGAVVDERFSSPPGVPEAGEGSYGSLTINPDGSATEKSSLLTLQVGASSRTTTKTLQEAVGSYSSVDGVDLNDARNLGTYVTINGHDFVVFKDPSGYMLPGPGSGWHALSFGRNEIVDVNFLFAADDTLLSQRNFRDDDQLFFQILSHLKFE